MYTNLPDSTFVLARQVNFEGIHKHNVIAERFGTLGEIRREIVAREHLNEQTTMQEWLEN